ncbi:MAG: hypothetical protein RLZZ200_2661 [Pseudomonadota bacterium]|jgi:hypothetical protein
MSEVGTAFAESVEPRTRAAWQWVESLLQDDTLWSGQFTAEAAELAARREGRLHVIDIRGADVATCRAAIPGLTPSGILYLDGGCEVRLRPFWSDTSVQADAELEWSETAGVTDRLLALLADPAYRLRHLLQTRRRYLDAAWIVRQHVRILRSAATVRRELLTRQSTATARVAGSGEPQDALRASLGDALGDVARRLQDGLRRSFSAEGRFHVRIGVELGKLVEQDFVREETRSEIRVSLGRQVQDEIAQLLRDLVDRELAHHVGEANRALAEIDRRARAGLLTDASVGAASFVGALNPADARSSLEEVLQVGVRYRGNLPRRGFLDRLGEGRKAIFGILMFVSLFGSFVGFNWRRVAWLGYLFMAIFVGAVFYTYRSWREEDALRISDELDKAREALGQELKRLAGETARELTSWAVEAVDQQRRQLQGRMDEVLRERQQGQQREQQQMREALQAQLRQVEVRDRQLQEIISGMQRAEMDLAAQRLGSGR